MDTEARKILHDVSRRFRYFYEVWFSLVAVTFDYFTYDSLEIGTSTLFN